MTNFDTLKAYVQAQLQKIIRLEQEKLQKIAGVHDYTMIGGTVIPLTAEQIATAKKAVQDEYDDRIRAVHDQIAATLDAAQKEANQEYANAVPRPTADEWREIQSMIERYKNSDDPHKEADFIEQRDFNIENETRLARIFVFAGRDLGITKTNADANAASDYDRMLDAVHRTTGNITAAVKLEQEELLIKIAPAMQTAQNHIDAVIDARRFYGIFKELALQEQLRELTPWNFEHFGTYSTWQQVQVERIAVTNRLFEMGADPNMDLVIFVNSALQ